jgi:pimeloyl-ACP methyl ester carboxylesterase
MEGVARRMGLTSRRAGDELPERLAVNGVELAWAEWGSGSGAPLVLCHGFTGGAIDFSLQIPALAERRRVIALDLRGHGRSTKTHDANSYSVSQLADDLNLFLDLAAGEPVDLVGHSMGGLVSMTAVLRRPDLAHSLVLMDTSAWSFLPADASLRKLVHNFMAKFDPARGVPSRVGGSPEDALIAAATPDDWRTFRDELYAGMDAWAYKALGSALMADDAGGTLPAQLPSITCPVTVLVGEHDHPLVDQAPELAAAVAHGRLAVIPGAYHSPQLTHPDEWRAALEEHLAVVHA